MFRDLRYNLSNQTVGNTKSFVLIDFISILVSKQLLPLHIPYIMLYKSHGHSDVGFVHENNEDSFLADEHKGVFAVADGVGGLPFGNLASRLAVRFLGAFIHDPEDCSTTDELCGVHRIVKYCGTWSVSWWGKWNWNDFFRYSRFTR